MPTSRALVNVICGLALALTNVILVFQSSNNRTVESKVTFSEERIKTALEQKDRPKKSRKIQPLPLLNESQLKEQLLLDYKYNDFEILSLGNMNTASDLDIREALSLNRRFAAMGKDINCWQAPLNTKGLNGTVL